MTGSADDLAPPLRRSWSRDRLAAVACGLLARRPSSCRRVDLARPPRARARPPDAPRRRRQRRLRHRPGRPPATGRCSAGRRTAAGPLASNTKLFTMAALLDRFGPWATFKTRLYARAGNAPPRAHAATGAWWSSGPATRRSASGSFARRYGLPLTPLGGLAGDDPQGRHQADQRQGPRRRLDLRPPSRDPDQRRRRLGRARPAVGPLVRFGHRSRPLRRQPGAGRRAGPEAQAAEDRGQGQGRHRPRRPAGPGAPQAARSEASAHPRWRACSRRP